MRTPDQIGRELAELQPLRDAMRAAAMEYRPQGFPDTVACIEFPVPVVGGPPENYKAAGVWFSRTPDSAWPAMRQWRRITDPATAAYFDRNWTHK